MYVWSSGGGVPFRNIGKHMIDLEWQIFLFYRFVWIDKRATPFVYCHFLLLTYLAKRGRGVWNRLY